MREWITSKLSMMWVQQVTTTSRAVLLQGGQAVLETRLWEGSFGNVDVEGLTQPSRRCLFHQPKSFEKEKR